MKIISSVQTEISPKLLEIHSHSMKIDRIEQNLEITNSRDYVVFGDQYMYSNYKINIQNYKFYFVKRTLDIYYLIVYFRNKIKIYKIYHENGSDYPSILSHYSVKITNKSKYNVISDKLILVSDSYFQVIDYINKTNNLQRVIWKKDKFVCTQESKKYLDEICLYYIDSNINFSEVIVKIFLNRNNKKNSNYYSFCEEVNDFVFSKINIFLNICNEELNLNYRNKLEKIIERYF